MKLSACIFLVSAGLLAGCASTCPAPAQAAATPTSTTRLTSAELPETEFAPLVGKPQHDLAQASSASDDDVDTKDTRKGERHPGGGFSGYK